MIINGINTVKNEEEYNDLMKAKNAFCHHYNISDAKWQTLYDILYPHTDKTIDDAGSIPNAIEQVNKSRPTFHVREYFEVEGKDAFQVNTAFKDSLGDVVNHYLIHLTWRMAVIRRLNDVMTKYNEWDVKCSQAAYAAGRTWNHHIVTHIGYRNDVKFISGVPGTRKEGSNKSSWGSNGFLVEFEVDGNWIDNVAKNNIAIVDIGGKRAMPLWANEIKGHDLEDEGVKLFEADVAWCKVPQDKCAWNGSLTPSDCIFNEIKYIAVQQTSGEPIIATGKNESWAIRTMRGRMKKQMLGMMDLI